MVIRRSQAFRETDAAKHDQENVTRSKVERQKQNHSLTPRSIHPKVEGIHLIKRGPGKEWDRELLSLEIFTAVTTNWRTCWQKLTLVRTTVLSQLVTLLRKDRRTGKCLTGSWTTHSFPRSSAIMIWRCAGAGTAKSLS